MKSQLYDTMAQFGEENQPQHPTYHSKKTLKISYVMMIIIIVIYVRESSLRVDTLNLLRGRAMLSLGFLI